MGLKNIIRFQKLVPEAVVPRRGTPGSAGLDLFALESIRLVVGARARKVRTGIAVAVPPWHVGLMRPRSSLAANQGVTMFSSGVIDADYRGEVLVPMVNWGDVDFVIEAAQAFAQLVVVPVHMGVPVVVNDLGSTSRGSGGFGSTGTGLSPDGADAFFDQAFDGIVTR
jgi:dUTP pyrophosphatase